MQNIILRDSEYDALANDTTVVHEGLSALQLIERETGARILRDSPAADKERLRFPPKGERVIRFVPIPCRTWRILWDLAHSKNLFVLLRLLCGLRICLIAGTLNVNLPIRLVPSNRCLKPRSPRIAVDVAHDIELDTLAKGKDVIVSYHNSDTDAVEATVTVTADDLGNATANLTIPTLYDQKSIILKVSHVVVAEADFVGDISEDIVHEEQIEMRIV